MPRDLNVMDFDESLRFDFAQWNQLIFRSRMIAIYSSFNFSQEISDFQLVSISTLSVQWFRLSIWRVTISACEKVQLKMHLRFIYSAQEFRKSISISIYVIKLNDRNAAWGAADVAIHANRQYFPSNLVFTKTKQNAFSFVDTLHACWIQSNQCDHSPVIKLMKWWRSATKDRLPCSSPSFAASERDKTISNLFESDQEAKSTIVFISLE